MKSVNLTQNQTSVKNGMRWQRNEHTLGQTGRAKQGEVRQAPRWAAPLKAGLPQGMVEIGVVRVYIQLAAGT